MLDIEIIGRVSTIEDTIRKEISYQSLNKDLDIEEITYNIRKYIDLLVELSNYSLDTIFIVKLNNNRDSYTIKLVKEV